MTNQAAYKLDELPFASDAGLFLPVLSLSGLRKLIARLTTRTPSPATDLLLKSVEALQRYVGDHVSAESASELAASVEDLLDDTEYQRLRADVARSVTADVMREAGRTEIDESVATALGPESRRELQTVGRMLRAAVGALHQHWAYEALHEHPRKTPEESLREVQEFLARDPMGFLTESAIPAPVRKLMVDAQLGDVALVGLGVLCERPHKKWQLEQLLAMASHGLQCHLALLAPMEGVIIPDDLLPAERRLDTGRIAQDHAMAESEHQTQLREARVMNADVHPPVGRLDD